MRPLEITDLLWSFDESGCRLPVRRDEVVSALSARSQRRAARIAARLPTVDGTFDADAVDALGLRVHCELQRLGEELQFGRRVAETLVPLIERIRETGSVPRIVDVGCGLGFVIRSLAAEHRLGPGVELVGIDLNPVLVARAAELAAAEGLACRFQQGDALRSDGVLHSAAERTIVISSGLLHHLDPADLPEFFAGQAHHRVRAFAHWDIAPCGWSTLGAWVFHRARMREPVSRHDGVLSARRAYPATVLERAAREGAPGYHPRVDEGGRWHPRALDVLRPIIGIRP